MHDVIAAAVTHEMPGTKKAEGNSGPEPSTTPSVHRIRTAGRNHAERNLEFCWVRVAMALGQVGDLMSFAGKFFGQATHPSLGTADVVRVETVVDEANP